MKILIKQAKIIDSNSPFHLQKRDILIERGIISSIRKSIPAKSTYKVVKAKNLKASPGWVDMHANFCDPGYEYREDLISGADAAAAGGFSDVAVLPNNNPILQSKSQVEYVINKTANHICNVHPLGALTADLKGDAPTEIYDMQQAGAIAFTDGEMPIKNLGILNRSLQYVKPFNGLVMSMPIDASLPGVNGVNEGKVSIKLGVKGLPSIAEEIAVMRDLKALEYTQSRLHIIQVSTKASVDHIRKCKKQGLQVTAAVSPYHLIYTDEQLDGFNSNFKLSPPLRGSNDTKALIKAVKDGTIDVISCLHIPQNIDDVKIEFEHVATGINGLQTTFALLKTHLANELTDEIIIQKLSHQPRKILNLPDIIIEQKNAACITLFNDEEWEFNDANNKSKSSNSPFLNTSLRGKVIGLINNNQLFLN